MKEVFHERSHKRLNLIYFPSGVREVFVGSDRDIPLVNIFMQKTCADPVDISELNQFCKNLPRLLDCTIQGNEKTRKNNFSGSSSDPFGRLAYEILIEVFVFLPVESIFAFQIASRAADIPLSNQFWRRRIQNDMPWLWELFGSVAMTKASRHLIDWRKVYMCLDTCSRDSFHARISGLVNRRRIWNLCSQLAELYVSKINPQKPTKSGLENVGEEVHRRTIRSTARLDPKTVEAEPFYSYTFMLLHISDLQRSLKILTTHWNPLRLIGISMTIPGRSRRLFAREALDGTQMVEKSVILEEGDWIDQLVLGLDNVGICSIKVWVIISNL